MMTEQNEKWFEEWVKSDTSGLTEGDIMIARRAVECAFEHSQGLLARARDRLNDMLKGDDGQAWKEAQRFVRELDGAIDERDKQAEPVGKDAEEYGPRLNDASWAAIEAWDTEAMGSMTGAVFNNIKGVVRAAILKYCEGYTPPPAQPLQAGKQTQPLHRFDLDSETSEFLADLVLANGEPVPITLSFGLIKDDDGKIKYGLKFWETECEEGGAVLIAESEPAQPVQPDFADAYDGAREDLVIWKKRALEAEELNRKFIASVNSPTFMGEPAQAALVRLTEEELLKCFLPSDYDIKGLTYDSGPYEVTKLKGSAKALFERVMDAMIAKAQPAPDVHADQSMWCRYIAGLICTYLKDGSHEKAITGIIGRRLWNLPERQTAPLIQLTPQQLLDAYIAGREANTPGMARYALHVRGLVAVQAAIINTMIIKETRS